MSRLTLGKSSLARPLLAWLVMPAIAWALTSAEWSARRERIEQLDPAAKDQLRRSWEWFQSNPDQQPALIKLNDYLEHEPDGDKLRTIALRYHDWYSKLRPGQQRELQELPAPARLELVKKWREEELNRHRVSQFLADDDIQAVLLWIRNNERFRWEGPTGRPPNAEAEKLPVRERLVRTLTSGFRFNGQQRVFERVTAEEAQKLLNSLTPTTRQRLAQTAKSPEGQVAQLREWLRTTAEVAFRNNWRPPNPDVLWGYFSSLPREAQVALESLSAGDMLQQLQHKMFSERPNPWRGGREGFGPGPDNDRGPMGPTGRGGPGGQRGDGPPGPGGGPESGRGGDRGEFNRPGEGRPGEGNFRGSGEGFRSRNRSTPEPVGPPESPPPAEPSAQSAE